MGILQRSSVTCHLFTSFLFWFLFLINCKERQGDQGKGVCVCWKVRCLIFVWKALHFGPTSIKQEKIVQQQFVELGEYMVAAGIASANLLERSRKGGRLSLQRKTVCWRKWDSA